MEASWRGGGTAVACPPADRQPLPTLGRASRASSGLVDALARPGPVDGTSLTNPRRLIQLLGRHSERLVRTGDSSQPFCSKLASTTIDRHIVASSAVNPPARAGHASGKRFEVNSSIQAAIMLPTPTPLTEQERATPKTEFKGRLVSSKKANSPFMVQERHKARVAARKAGKEKDGGAAESIGGPVASVMGGTIKYTLLALLASLLLSRMVTEQWFWGYEGKYVKPHYWFPPKQRSFTPASLARHTGHSPDPKIPLLLAIDGQVYDVSANRGMYGPGATYNIFAGKDASRAFATGCFKTHLTHDLRGLTEIQQKSLDHWKGFFANSPKYPKVGRIVFPPIDPLSSVPEMCDPKTEGGAR